MPKIGLGISPSKRLNSRQSLLSQTGMRACTYFSTLQGLLLTYIISIPKISSHSIEPYIISTKNGTHVDTKHLVSEEQRKQANGIRVVQDPVEIKKKAAEVCREISSSSPKVSSMRKT
jgi:hypothetical protein